jgi:hypothetical protein
LGPITSTAITALAPAAEGFPAGRDFAAWLGLTPLRKSTGGKQKLGAVSKRGERTIRRLLIIGASAVVQQASRRGASKGSWLARMLARKPKMLVTVALVQRFPNYRFVEADAMYARYGKQRADIAGGSDGCGATRHYAFNCSRPVPCAGLYFALADRSDGPGGAGSHNPGLS